jgi:uncharacterized delta-60 repeat protein
MKYFRCRTQHLRQNFLFGFLAVGLFLVLPALTLAAPGDLDPTFGSGGIVITRDSDIPQLDYSYAMAIQSDGKIVVVGEGSAGTFNWDFAVVRYNPDGSLDRSFGGIGIVITQLTYNYDGAHAVAVQADGKIVVAGSRYDGTGGSSFAVVRYHPNGSLDTSFNGTGIVITSVNGSPSSVAIQADGKIVVAGGSRNGSISDFALVRYNPDGSLDPAFNGTGKVITQAGSGAVSVAVQGDGKIIAVGGSTVVRYNTDGSLDTTFNGTGKVITAAGGANSIAIQSDGKIVTAGSSHNGIHQDFAVVRYHPNGSLDSSFGGTGKILIPVGNSDSGADSVVIQTNGKIVVAGIATSNNVVNDFAVVRLNQNGSQDNTFNSSGKVITPVTAGNDIVTGAAIQADGKIVVAGMSDEFLSDFYDFVVVRYQGDAPPSACPNPIDCADFFVRQHYLDFLSREPDAPGLAHWAGEITACDDPSRRQPGESLALCIERQRIDTSAAFFLSPEFQYTGYFVYRLYKGSLIQNGAGRFPTYQEFLRDVQQVAGGIIQNNQLSAATIEQNKKTFAEEFARRAEFRSLYDPLSNFDYVERLFQTTGINVSSQEKQALVDGLNNQTETRASVLQKVVDGTVVIAEGNQQFTTAYGQAFYQKEFNPAFVLMEYFGYLHRDPDAAGYQHWLDKLNVYHNYIDAEMVKSFITSPEYRARFGQP